DSQLSQPQIDSRRFPSIAIAGQQQLVPISAAGIARHSHAEFLFGSATHSIAASLRGCRISHRLVLWITAVPDPVRQQNRPVSRPRGRVFGLGKLTRDGQAVPWTQVAHFLPAKRAIQTVLAGGADFAATCKLQLIYRLPADLPDEVGLCSRESTVLGHGHNF